MVITPSGEQSQSIIRAFEDPPRLVPGLELLGEFQGSGSIDPLFLLKRPDGRIVAVSALLYQVAAAIDGRRDLAAVASRASGELRRAIRPEAVRFAIDEKLTALGIVLGAGDDGHRASPRPNALLGLRARGAVLPPRLVEVASSALSHLFKPPVVAVLLVATVAFESWLVLAHGIRGALGYAAVEPWPMLFVFASVLASGAFHELGHAAAGHYSGAKPGRIGVGFYLLWPAFFSEMTDSYRLSRTGRIRTDLGGVYFNAVFILASAIAYAATGFEPILAAIVAQHLLVACQFLPFLRLDGYYLVSDLAGVPDLFSHIGPVLRSLLPGTKTQSTVRALRPWVRAVVTMWVLVTVPLLIGALGFTLLHSPTMLDSAWEGVLMEAQKLSQAFRAGDVGRGVLAAIGLLASTLLPFGMALMVAGLGVQARQRWVSRHGRLERPAPGSGTAAISSNPSRSSGAKVSRPTRNAEAWMVFTVGVLVVMQLAGRRGRARAIRRHRMS